MTTHRAKERKIFSIILASNKPDNLLGFFDNLEETAESMERFEVLVKVDEEQTEMVDLLKEQKEKRPFEIRYIATPKGDGYYTLHHAYQTLFEETSDPETYFLSVFTDEIRFQTTHWDRNLTKYVGLFPDDVFRLRISDFRNKNYYSMYECLPEPENYSITTRQWYELAQGMCAVSDDLEDIFWGVDSWHQCIEYYLGQCLSPTMTKGIYRGWAIHDIEMGGLDAGVGWEGAEAVERGRRVGKAWSALRAYKYHQNFYRLAQRLAAHVWAHHLGHPEYQLITDVPNRQHLIYTGPPEETPPLTGRSYKLPWRAYLRERIPPLLDLHKVPRTNIIRYILRRFPRRTHGLIERALRRFLILNARLWILRKARKLPHKVVENVELKQVLVVDPRDMRPLIGWSYGLG